MFAPTYVISLTVANRDRRSITRPAHTRNLVIVIKFDAILRLDLLALLFVQVLFIIIKIIIKIVVLCTCFLVGLFQLLESLLCSHVCFDEVIWVQEPVDKVRLFYHIVFPDNIIRIEDVIFDILRKKLLHSWSDSVEELL